ncbi:MAG TPA: type 2 isopentenyl-diphosphate Delta-isomerase [Kofleriaceae bacterium]|nr:type 2 isopentenyl-diphosphate Delta-isomerase [Kofleriaceae bacterium]
MAASPKVEPAIARRKADHIEIAASGRANFANNHTLLDQVTLVHQALPELAMADIDLSTQLAGQQLRAPLVITGMTGGTAEAQQINRDLARAAERCGVALGLGSQRAMAEHEDLVATYTVRDVAPDAVIFGNIGGVQARTLGVAKVAELAKRIGANAMCVHLNPGQEMIQPDGDRDFRGVLATIAQLVENLRVPVIVKETGCGLSMQAAAQLRRIGVATVDVAGAGGTSWIAVEAERALADSNEQALGREYWDWGLPTAVATVACAQVGHEVIASGGVRHGLDIARALALGATCGGMAAPMLRAQRAAGFDGVVQMIERTTHSIRTACLLTGTAAARDLVRAPKHLGDELVRYLISCGAQ